MTYLISLEKGVIVALSPYPSKVGPKKKSVHLAIVMSCGFHQVNIITSFDRLQPLFKQMYLKEKVVLQSSGL